MRSADEFSELFVVFSSLRQVLLDPECLITPYNISVQLARQPSTVQIGVKWIQMGQMGSRHLKDLEKRPPR